MIIFKFKHTMWTNQKATPHYHTLTPLTDGSVNDTTHQTGSNTDGTIRPAQAAALAAAQASNSARAGTTAPETDGSARPFNQT
jgi:hypothetical protein